MPLDRFKAIQNMGSRQEHLSVQSTKSKEGQVKKRCARFSVSQLHGIQLKFDQPFLLYVRKSCNMWISFMGIGLDIWT